MPSTECSRSRPAQSKANKTKRRYPSQRKRRNFGGVRGEGESRKARTYHGLHAHVVTDVICVAVIDDGAHTGVDDRLESWARRTHPVTGRGELVVYAEVAVLPYRLGANFGSHCWVVKIWFKLGRIWVRKRRGHIILIPDS